MSDEEPAVTFQTIAAQQTVSRTELDAGFDLTGFLMESLFPTPPTPESRARAAAYEAAVRAELLARAAAWQGIRDGSTDLIGAILDIHKPDDRGHCQTCGGDEWDQDWPCETAELVLNDAATGA